MYQGGASDKYEEYTIETPLIQVKHDVTGQLIDVSMVHKWPVRKPRPVAEKLPGREALITGQRVIDVSGGGCGAQAGVRVNRDVEPANLQPYSTSNVFNLARCCRCSSPPCWEGHAPSPARLAAGRLVFLR